MTTLTKLEMNVLHKMTSDLQAIVDSTKMKSDNINDFIFEQVDIKTDEPDLLKSVVDHLKLVNEKIDDMAVSMDLIMDHFDFV